MNKMEWNKIDFFDIDKHSWPPENELFLIWIPSADKGFKINIAFRIGDYYYELDPDDEQGNAWDGESEFKSSMAIPGFWLAQDVYAWMELPKPPKED